MVNHRLHSGGSIRVLHMMKLASRAPFGRRKRARYGRPLFHWENVSRVKTGDVIFHYADGNLRAVSRAKSNGYEAKKQLGSAEWSDDGWQVDSDYCVLARPIPIEEVGSKIAALHLNKGPVNRTGGVNQGYLFEITADAAAILIAAMGDDPALVDCGINQAQIPAQYSDKLPLADSGISQVKIADHQGGVTNSLYCARSSLHW